MNKTRTIKVARWIGLLILPLLLNAARAADPSSPEYKAGYDAGYKAAMEALKAQAASAACCAPGKMMMGQGEKATAPADHSSHAAPAPQASAAAEPPDWWNHSAHLYSKLEPVWRHHIEVQFTGASLNGNDTGYALRGSGKLFSRYKDWTNELIASLDKRHIAQAGGAINQRDYKMLQDSARYDINGKLYTAAGFIMERDDVNFIDRRNTVLAGLGYYLLDNSSMRLNVFGGLGRLHESYLAPVPALIGLGGRSSQLLYLYQTFDWQLAQNWSLQQGFRQIRDLDESGVYVLDPTRPGLYTAGSMVKRYRNVSNLSLNYQLSPRSAVSLGIESRYDSNPWPDVKPRDTTKRLSLNLMY